MQFLLRVIVLSLLLVVPASAEEKGRPGERPAPAPPGEAAPPPTMTRLVFRSEMPGLDPKSADALPKKLWRAGERWGRIEHPRNPETGAIPIVIVASPDAWFADSAQRTVEHFRDPGPTYRFRAPIVQPSKELPKSLEELEFGRELAFMEKRGAAAEHKRSEKGDETDVYLADFDGVRVLISAEPGTQRVTNTVVLQGKVLLAAYRYSEYVPKEPTEATLFQPPKGFRNVERKKAQPKAENGPGSAK
jgi:hypothetical protein